MNCMHETYKMVVRKTDCSMKYLLNRLSSRFQLLEDYQLDSE